MAWWRIGDKQLSEHMLIRFAGAYQWQCHVTQKVIIFLFAICCVLLHKCFGRPEWLPKNVLSSICCVQTRHRKIVTGPTWPLLYVHYDGCDKESHETALCVVNVRVVRKLGTIVGGGVVLKLWSSRSKLTPRKLSNSLITGIFTARRHVLMFPPT